METPLSNDDRRSAADVHVWRTLGILWNRRALIIAVTGVAAVLSVVISLLLPNWYRASSRLLLPASSGGGLAGALLGDLGSAAQSLLGTSGGDYVRYLAILKSRAVLASAVDSFDLVTVYEYQDSDTPMEDAIEDLDDLVELYVDDEYDFLSIQVLDRDPERAADLANYMVRALDRVNNQLSTQTASNFRRYVELRYEESQRTRGALLDSLRAFQRRYGVFDLQAQTTAFFDQLAQLRVSAVEAEIQYEALRDQLGPANARVKGLESVVQAANRSFARALAGREEVFPVAQDVAPDVVRAFLDLEMERTIQERILEFVAPMLEQARFEEQRQGEAVQIVDAAVAPVKKDRPKRSIICVAATLSAFILIVLYVLLSTWWRGAAPDLARRLREAAADTSSA